MLNTGPNCSRYVDLVVRFTYCNDITLSCISWNAGTSYHLTQVGWKVAKLKATNLEFEDEAVLPTVLRYDDGKVFTSDNHHLQKCCLFTKDRGQPLK